MIFVEYHLQDLRKPKIDINTDNAVNAEYGFYYSTAGNSCCFKNYKFSCNFKKWHLHLFLLTQNVSRGSSWWRNRRGDRPKHILWTRMIFNSFSFVCHLQINSLSNFCNNNIFTISDVDKSEGIVCQLNKYRTQVFWLVPPRKVTSM